MIEKTILDYLGTQLSVPVYMERPLDPPASYVILERTGGSISNVVIGSATFAVQTYAASLFGAASLAHTVVDVIGGLEAYAEVSDVAIDGLYNFTDTQTKDYRYQVVVHVIYYHMETGTSGVDSGTSSGTISGTSAGTNNA